MMNTQTRKLEIIEQVLHLESEEALAIIEQALEMLQTSIPSEDDIPAMPLRSKQEITDRLAQAEDDVRAGRTFTTQEVLARIEQQRGA
ncbi:hypothetical protein [Hymenobacter sp. IS2118]|uniref:hypothetical protein n=1 Tax=Hymenobacter sp. IS2118 TaxID=1505605 RepID=UPI00054FD5CC|nr:hypothetical protein [Hymenobacter sp. IS2118]